jgi:hypothetical protein
MSEVDFAKLELFKIPKMFPMKTIWITTLASLALSAFTGAAWAQESDAYTPSTVTPSTQTADVDALARELDNRFTPIRKGPTLLKVPFSYRFAAICNAQTKETLENYFFKSSSSTGSVILTKPEQLPAEFRTVADCPQCRREVTYKVRINNAFSDWLRATPQSFREEISTFCETRV